jgi:hypothetical protein
MDFQIPLLVSALAFFAFLVFRVVPWGGQGERGAPKEARAALARAEEAKSDADRALALADAGEASAKVLGRGGSSAALFLRAMKSDPCSVEIVNRAATALGRKRRSLEHLLWRRLAQEPFRRETRDANMAALSALAKLYENSPPKLRLRGAAIEHMLSALRNTAE